MSVTVNLSDLANLDNPNTAVTAINSNNSQITEAFDRTLSRYGDAANMMQASLDMNSNRIINLPQAVFDQEPVRLEEFNRALFNATSVVLSYGLSNGLNFDTRAAAQATAIPAPINYITISKYATGLPRSDAPYVRGGIVIPLTDALGATWGLDLTGGKIDAFWFGAVGDGVADDTAVLQTAANNCAGCTLYFKGRFGLSSRISLVTNSTLQGLGSTSGFVALGSNSFTRGLLYIDNQSNINIRNLYFQGNLVEPAAFCSGAIRIELDTIATSDIEDISITGCTFRNFKQSEWIGVFVTASPLNTNRLVGLNISDNYAYAVPQCASTTGGNNFVTLFANTQATSPTVGDISNVIFRNNKIVGLGLAGAIAGYCSVHDVSVTGNTTLNMGNSSVLTDRTYTYLFYNSNPTSFCPYNISIVGNSGYGNKNNAVYLAGALDSVVSGNSFEFTYAGGIEPTLPWGASIALNGVRNVSVTGNSLTNALGGVAYVGVTGPTIPGQTSDGVVISGNVITNTIQTSVTQIPYGVLLSGDAANTDALTVVSGNTIKVTNTQSCGILIAGSNVSPLNIGNVKISSNLIEAGGSGVSTINLINTKGLELSNNRIYGALQSYCLDINFNAGPLFMNDNLADFSQVVIGSSGGIRITGEVYINGLMLYKKTNGGDALTLNGATGTICNVTFPKQGNTTSFITSGGLGTTLPTHVGQLNDFVQNLGGPTEVGTAGSKYMLRGWINADQATTWLPQRILTGN